MNIHTVNKLGQAYTITAQWKHGVDDAARQRNSVPEYLANCPRPCQKC